MLKANPGVDTNQVKIQRMVNAVKGLANSFELNDMYGKGDLKSYSSANDFINRFKQIYTQKAEKDINSAKRDKAETPQAKARAKADRQNVANGLKTVLGMF
jgi:hypothetical protein